MADQKQCSYALPHEFHGWEEQSVGPFGHRRYHVCDGVPEAELRELKCPECRDGKCRNCTGWTIDTKDDLIDCGCACTKEDQ